jgi:hypothetical protein
MRVFTPPPLSLDGTFQFNRLTFVKERDCAGGEKEMRGRRTSDEKTVSFDWVKVVLIITSDPASTERRENSTSPSVVVQMNEESVKEREVPDETTSKDGPIEVKNEREMSKNDKSPSFITPAVPSPFKSSVKEIVACSSSSVDFTVVPVKSSFESVSVDEMMNNSLSVAVLKWVIPTFIV